MGVLLVVLIAGLLVSGVYFGVERLGKKAAVPASLRFIAWTGLGLLLLDISCARPPDAIRPLVLLDASLSMGTTPARWAEARAAASRLGEIRFVGALGPDSAPLGGRSRLTPAVTAAVAGGRPVWVVTDGEIEDRAELPADLLARTGVSLFPREPRPDVALTRVAGPSRLSVGDTLRLEVDVTGFGTPGPREIVVDVGAEGTRWFSGVVALGAGGSGSATIVGKVSTAAAPGNHLLDVTLREPADAEPRTDRRLHPLTVLPTPGIVVVASPAGWESRFLFRTLVDVAALPVKGYFRVDGTRWARMGDLTPVTPAEVQLAAGNADLLVRFGDPPESFRKSRARAQWEWIGTSAAAAAVDGDWYLGPGGASPVAGALVGLPLDSFPPVVGLTSITPGPRDWVGLVGQLNRRGTERPAVVGRDSSGRRVVTVAVAGLWRWAFRGGPSEQAYRAWIAATTSWLLGASDSTTGRARPVWPVVEQGRPVVFERLRPDVAELRLDLNGPGGPRIDTLRFDGSGRALLELPPGGYQYRLEGGGAGQLGIEEYSEELLPRPVVLADQAATAPVPPGRSPARDRWWLYGVVVVALSGEWWWRRRSGLR